MIKIVVGQAHLNPKNLSEEDALQSSNVLNFRRHYAVLNTGFNIYILFHRLMEVPGIGYVLMSSIIPSDEELRKLNDSGLGYF